MFPFFDLNDTELVKLFCKKKKKITKKLIQSHQTDANVTIRNKICNVCIKRNKIDKSLGLRLSEIRDIKNSKMETHCECQT